MTPTRQRRKRYTNPTKFFDLLALPLVALLTWWRRKRGERKGKR